MKKYIAASILALCMAIPPVSPASALDVGIGPDGVRLRDHDRDRDRDHGFRDRDRDFDHGRRHFVRGDDDRGGCRTVIVRTHRDGMTVTKRIRHCG